MKFLLLFFLVLVVSTVRGATYTVNNSGDGPGSCPTNCTLRQAIQDAINNPGGDYINFDASVTAINLTLGCLTINDPSNASLNIMGNVTINTTGTDSAFCIQSNNITLDGLTVQGNTNSGQAIIYAQNASNITLTNLTVQNNQNGGGIYFDSVTAPTPPSATIYQSIIRNNGFSGIQILNSSRVHVVNSQIYGNDQEGVLIKDSSDNQIDSNYIGTNSSSTGPVNDPITSVLPNKNSGVAILSENSSSKNNIISKNRIAYNKYQNILLSGSGTDSNFVEQNQIYSDFCRDTSLPPANLGPNNGVVVSDKAKSNTIRQNRIECHFYNAVQIVGQGSDKNEIVKHQGIITGVFGSLSSIIRKHGTAILVTNDYNNTSFPTTSTSSPSIPNGPDLTYIVENTIEDANYHGIHAILATNIYILSNTIQDTSNNGILMVGSSGRIGIDPDGNSLGNTITPNVPAGSGSAGIRVEAHYGSDTNYQNYSDDVNSDLVIKNNNISNADFGILGLDNEIDSTQNPSQLNSSNTISNTNSARVLQQWFGIVEILDGLGNPITSITAGAIVSPTCPWDNRNLQAYNNGAWGPTGLNLYNVYTWVANGILLTDDYVDNSGNYINCNPRNIIAYAAPLYGTAQFSFDGNSNTHPVSPDLSLPSHSPSGSQNARYQIAQVQLLGPSAAEAVIKGKVISETGRRIPYVDIVVLGSSNQWRVKTNLLGEYRLSVPSGEVYIIRAQSKRYRFTPEEYVLNVQEDIQGIDFTALEKGIIQKKETIQEKDFFPNKRNP